MARSFRGTRATGWPIVAQFAHRGTVQGMDQPTGPKGQEGWDAEGRKRPDRPWWGNPLVWVAISATLLLTGLFVAPAFSGGR